MNKSEELLKNTKFLANAGIEKIKNEKKNKVHDFKLNLESHILIINSELNKLIGEPFISYFVEEIRFNEYQNDLFTEDYFSIVNMKDIKDEEKELLLYLIKNDKLLDLFNDNFNRL